MVRLLHILIYSRGMSCLLSILDHDETTTGGGGGGCGKWQGIGFVCHVHRQVECPCILGRGGGGGNPDVEGSCLCCAGLASLAGSQIPLNVQSHMLGLSGGGGGSSMYYIISILVNDVMSNEHTVV